MEFNVFKVLLRHTENIARVGKEYIATLYILCHVLIFAFFEVFEFFLVVGFHPTSFV